MKKVTPLTLRAMKGGGKIAALTAYDAQTARFLEAAGIPFILVGDSVGTTQLGYESTIPVTLEDMIRHTAAVARGAKTPLIVADMPFMTYQAGVEQALLNAGRLMQEGGCDAVKLEGGAFRAATVRALVENGIPVCAHIGLTPQSVKEIGLRVQGRGEEAAAKLLADAKALEEAGAFAIVLEGIPAPLAERITAETGIPTIGIGAGAGCDGQILVISDVLGLGGAYHPKFAKVYAEVGKAITAAAAAYKAEVQGGAFPDEAHSYAD
jgi:3-methyl-2-oxobutanoate hydroxymethyltransferase